MHFVKKKPQEKRADLDNKLKSNKILRVPGAYNPQQQKLLKKLGMMLCMFLVELCLMT